MAEVPSAGHSQHQSTPPGNGAPGTGLGGPGGPEEEPGRPEEEPRRPEEGPEGPGRPEDDWDQEASLAAFVAEVEAKRAHGLIDIDDYYDLDDPDDGYDLPDGYCGPDGLAAGRPEPESAGPPRDVAARSAAGRPEPESAGPPRDVAARSAAGRPEPDAGLLAWGSDGGRDDGGPDRDGGSGFASGGVWDKALPGPGLAEAADAAAGPARGYGDTSDDELIGILGGWQRIESWAAAGRLSAVAELIRRRPGTHGDRATCSGIPASWGKFCADEVAVALSISRWAAERTTALARDLATCLPATNRALGEGVIDAYKAQVIAEATRVLDDAATAEAEASVFASGVAGKTPGQIRALIARAVLKADPAGAKKRREQAQRDARVELWREDAGTAAICGFGLPPDAALAADQEITARAKDLKAAGVPGTTDQLRVRAYLDALLGQDSAARCQAAQAAPATEPGASPAGEGTQPSESPHDGNGRAQDSEPQDSPAQDGPAQDGPAQDGPAQDSPAQDSPAQDSPAQDSPAQDSPAQDSPAQDSPAQDGPAVGRGNSQAGQVADAGHPKARINLTIPLATLLGLAEHPGEAAGFGPIDPALARNLAAQAAGNPATTWCVTVTDPGGHPLAHGCAQPGNPKRTRHRHTRPPRPPSPASTPPGRGGEPPGHSASDSGAPPTSRRPGRPASDSGAPPTSGRPNSYGTWRLQLPTLSETGPPGAPGLPDLTVDLEPLPVTSCDHRHYSAGHDPSPRLRHLVEIRDGECDYPPCRRAAARCDFEHTIAWEDGGATCGCNAGPRCRHHHHTKQHPGWRVEQHQPGYRTWTTPAGRTYTTGPTTYPV